MTCKLYLHFFFSKERGGSQGVGGDEVTHDRVFEAGPTQKGSERIKRSGLTCDSELLGAVPVPSEIDSICPLCLVRETLCVRLPGCCKQGHRLGLNTRHVFAPVLEAGGHGQGEGRAGSS